MKSFTVFSISIILFGALIIACDRLGVVSLSDQQFKVLAIFIALNVQAIVVLWGLVFVYGFVHFGLGEVCSWHARRFCTGKGLEVEKLQWKPQIEAWGRTESLLVLLDCVDAHEQRRLVLLSVWPLGVREMIGNQPYPDSIDGYWPPSGATKPVEPTGTGRLLFDPPPNHVIVLLG